MNKTNLIWIFVLILLVLPSVHAATSNISIRVDATIENTGTITGIIGGTQYRSTQRFNMSDNGYISSVRCRTASFVGNGYRMNVTIMNDLNSTRPGITKAGGTTNYTFSGNSGWKTWNLTGTTPLVKGSKYWVQIEPTSVISGDSYADMYYIGGTDYLGATYTQCRKDTGLNWDCHPAARGDTACLLTYVITASNFTITAKDSSYGTSITSFNATVNASGFNQKYTTTTGTITTGITSLSTKIVNISVKPAGYPYFYGSLGTLTGYNTTPGTRQFNFTSLRYKFNITAKYKGANKNFTTTLRDLNGTETLNYTSVNGKVLARPLINHYYNISIDPSGYAIPATQLRIANTIFKAINFSLQISNQFNFVFRNALTNALLTPNNISVELISDSFAFNSSTRTGYWNKTLLIPEDYTIRAKTPAFYDSLWFFTLSNRTYNNFTLYMTANASGTPVSAFVYDQTGAALEGAYVKVKRYDTATNSYVVKEIGLTNYIGKTVIHPILNTEFYKFTIEYGGEVVKETTATYIYNSDPIVFYVTIGQGVLNDFFTAQGITHSLDYNNATQNVRFTYNDVANGIYGGQLDCFGTFGITKTTIGHTIVNSPSTTILMNIPGVNGTIYNCNAYILGSSATSKTLVDSITIDNYVMNRLNSPILLFLMIILTIAFSFLVRWDLRIASILVPLPMFFFSMLGLVTINKGLATGFLVLGFILAVIIKREWA